jgi:hypothetical protein
MKRPSGLSVLVLLVLSAGAYGGGQQLFPRLEGPYLGQKPPGMSPLPFAPGIITTDEEEGSSGFALGGTAFLFQKFRSARCLTYITRLEDGVWTAPSLIPFWETMADNGDFVISSDDRTMLYQVKTDKDGLLLSDVWTVKLQAAGWGDRTPLPAPVNTSDDNESYAWTRPAGTFISSATAAAERPVRPVHVPLRGRKIRRQPPTSSLNTEFNEWDPFVAPDEDYLIFCSMKPGGLGRDDLYISFKGRDGRWGPPVSLGEEINSPGSENRPCVTHDGKYFFFTSTRDGSRDVFWVEAGYLERFRK